MNSSMSLWPRLLGDWWVEEGIIGCPSDIGLADLEKLGINGRACPARPAT